MSETIRDKRLFAIHTIENKNDRFEIFPQQNMSYEKLYVFASPIDHIMGGTFLRKFKDEEDEKSTIDELEESLSGFRDSSWKYAQQIFHYYDTCHLTTPVYEQCMRILKADEETWFKWVDSIPFSGIQCVFLQYAPSIQCLISFMQYLLQQREKTEKREYLLAMVTLFFIEKLKIIGRNLQSNNVSKIKKINWNLDEWETEADGYITAFINLLFQWPQEQLEGFVLSFFSNIWVYDNKRAKIEKKIRNMMLEQLVSNLLTAEDIKAVLFNPRWENTKSAILHKLLIYVEWTLEQNKRSNDCNHLLWEQVIACLETENTYLHYNQPDDQLFSWIFGKLLAEEPAPLEKIKSILDRYHQRYGVWDRDYEQVFQFQRARFFFLTTGAMASEWLLREETTVKKNVANKMIQYIFDESQLVIDGFYDGAKDELNFLQQFWARYALFQTKETTEEDANKMLYALKSIDSIEYRFIAISDFLRNLSDENKGPWFYDVLVKGLLSIIGRDNEMIKYWNDHLLKDAKRIEKKGMEIVETLKLR